MPRPILTLLLLTLAAPAFAQTDEPGSKDHAMVPRLASYYIAGYDATDFNKVEFPVTDDKDEAVEGKHWELRYELKDNARRASPLEILRNYQNAFRAKSGTVVYGNDGKTTLRMKTGTSELWCLVETFNDGEIYEIHIIERAAINQQVALNAAELARALDEKGSVALHDILFDTGKATLTAGSSAALAVVGDLLKNDQSLRLEVQGHTDNVGAKPANLALSQARAAAVRDYLIKTFGVMPERLTSAGFGDTKPIGDNATDAGRAQNRRVDLVKTAAKAAPGAGAAAPGSGQAANGSGQWTGRVTTGIMAVGGETTGIILATSTDRLELQGTPALRARLNELNGKTVTVRGRLETREGVEIRTRRIIHVTTVEAETP